MYFDWLKAVPSDWDSLFRNELMAHPTNPVEVGRADANPKLLLNDT